MDLAILVSGWDKNGSDGINDEAYGNSIGDLFFIISSINLLSRWNMRFTFFLWDL